MNRAAALAALFCCIATSARAEPGTIRIAGTDLGVREMWGRAAAPTLTDGKTTIQRGRPGDLALPVGRRLAELQFRASPREQPWKLLIDARENHRYRVHPDPCCFLAIEDLDSDLNPEARAKPLCVDYGGECQDGYANVPSWIARDSRCGEEQHTCVRVTRVRFEISRAALRTGPLEIFVEDRDEPAWILSLDGDRVMLQRGRDEPRAPLAAADWETWPWTRETSPARVLIRRGGALLWEREVQLRLEHRYTIRVNEDPKATEIFRED